MLQKLSKEFLGYYKEWRREEDRWTDVKYQINFALLLLVSRNIICSVYWLFALVYMRNHDYFIFKYGKKIYKVRMVCVFDHRIMKNTSLCLCLLSEILKENLIQKLLLKRSVCVRDYFLLTFKLRIEISCCLYRYNFKPKCKTTLLLFHVRVFQSTGNILVIDLVLKNSNFIYFTFSFCWFILYIVKIILNS